MKKIGVFLISIIILIAISMFFVTQEKPEIEILSKAKKEKVDIWELKESKGEITSTERQASIIILQQEKQLLKKINSDPDFKGLPQGAQDYINKNFFRILEIYKTKEGLDAIEDYEEIEQRFWEIIKMKDHIKDEDLTSEEKEKLREMMDHKEYVEDEIIEQSEVVEQEERNLEMDEDLYPRSKD